MLDLSPRLSIVSKHRKLGSFLMDTWIDYNPISGEALQEVRSSQAIVDRQIHWLFRQFIYDGLPK